MFIMKKKCISFFILFFILACHVSALTLSNLEFLCSKQSWVEVNEYLEPLSWKFNGSKDNAVQWALNYDRWSDKAEAFVIYFWKDKESCLAYQSSKESINRSIQNQLQSRKYVRIGSRIDGEQRNVIIYSNNNFIVEEILYKVEDNGNNIHGKAWTIYRVGSLWDDNNGVKKTYYDNGNVKSTYVVRNGKRNGPVSEYYENGNIHKKYNIKNGDVFDGQVITYYQNGNVESSYVYKNGKINGLVSSYYENGNIKMKSYAINGLKDGPETKYYQNGNIESSYVMKNGKINGPICYYYENGNIYKKFSTKNGNIDGPFVMYYENGNIMEENFYVDGVENGKFIKYLSDSNQNERVEGTMANGQPHGCLKYYTSDGKLDMESNYNNGKKEGHEYLYNNGKIMVDAIYENDLLNGKCIVYTNDKDTTQLYMYYKNGILDGPYYCTPDSAKGLCKGMYSNGKREGKWEELNDDLSSIPFMTYFEIPDSTLVESSGVYKNDKKDGKWTNEITYRSDSVSICTVIVRANFKNGILSGDYEITRQTDTYIGNIGIPFMTLETITGEFKNGAKNGEWKRYDDLGRPISVKAIYSNDNLIEQDFYLGDSISVKFNYDKHSIKMTVYRVDFMWKRLKILPHKLEYEFYCTSLPKQMFNYPEIDESYCYSRQYDKEGRVMAEGTIHDGKFKNIDYGRRIFEGDKGAWTYYDYNKGIIIQESDKQDSAVTYKTLSGEPFSGVYENDREIIKIKNGLRDGVTKVIDSTTGKIIKKVTYSKGICKRNCN